MKYVIIGNSAAAVGAVEGIRSVDKKGEITIISKEKYHTYSRPLISYLLLGKTNEEKMKYRNDGFYEENGCKTLLGIEAVKVDAEKKEVYLSNGKTIKYDKLLTAVGSRPFIPDFEGIDKVVNLSSFMSLENAHFLQNTLNAESDVLIIGAGLIGLKCAEGILERVKSVTVVDLSDKILSSILDERASSKMKTHLEKRGIKFKLGVSVAKFDKNEATLTDGDKIIFDCLVTAIGVRPNIEILAQAGAKTGKGIVINEKCETTLKDIYAAGDCTLSKDSVSGTEKNLALLPNAYMQGFCAGENMAGKDKIFDKAMALNAIGLFGLHIISAGNYDGDSIVSEKGDTYKKLVVKDDRLIGFIMLGNVDRAGIYTSLIRNKTPLSCIDFEMIAQEPRLMAFSQKERVEILGGAAI